MNLIKAILFDLDGTLIDTNELIIQSFKYILKEHLNIEADEKELVMYFGEPLAKTLARYDEAKAEMLTEAYKEYNENIHDDLTKEVLGSKETLKELITMGIMTGVVTSKRRAIAERGLKLFNLMEALDVIITPEDTTKHKPDGEPVLKACEVLGIKPEEAIMVGDSHFDILCGQNAGAKTALVKYTALPVDKIMEYDPSYAIDNLEDLLVIVRKENFS